MPSALETLVKILKLEREQGYKNTAVIGGVSAFADRWQSDAHTQAKKPEHHVLVDEIVALLAQYDDLGTREKRHDAITQVLDRIMGRTSRAETQPTQGSEKQPTMRRQRGKVDRSRRPAPQLDKPATAHEEQQDAPVESTVILEDAAPVAPASTTELEAGAHAIPAPDAPFPPEEFAAPTPQKPKPRRRKRPDIPFDEAVTRLKGLDAPVEVIDGIGPRIAQKLEKLGVVCVSDLLFHLPRRYDDYTRLEPIDHARPGQTMTLIGTIRNSTVLKGRSGREYLQVTVDDGTGTLNISFFGQPYLRRQLTKGMQIVVSGKVERFLGKAAMTNPEWEPLEYDNLHTRAIVPVYPLTQGLSTRTLRRILKSTVEYWADHLPDYMPESVLNRAKLVDLGWALRQIHFPDNWDYLAYARERFAFNELFQLQLKMLARRRAWQSQPGITITVEDEWLNAAVAALPFALTHAQQQALSEIRADLGRDTPMNRLLQGDVGSGKTVVAALAAAAAIRCGGQAAVMAPTSILAEQHYQSFSRLLAAMPLEQPAAVRLLTGATPVQEREEIRGGLADGSIHVLVGTQALIQESVELSRLALAVIDEQHRFGVEQRGALRGKGSNPHLLVMTATPIPRTLALTLHADLDLSTIHEMPPGRMPIETHLLPEPERERAYTLIKAEIARGRQAFIVYPLVEGDGEEGNAQAATDEYERLRQDVFPRQRLGLLHGRMSASEKEATMAAMQRGEIDILVSTSVVEVGIDIPNASVMLIEGANRFGLAQLHQFRGRVGRGEHASYCLLLGDDSTSAARERLEALTRTNDGFELAEIDFQMRGAGDLFGTRQSGMKSLLRFGDAMDSELVALAQREARTLYAEDPELSLPEHRLLAERIEMIYSTETDLS